jgi:hypothetical protein
METPATKNLLENINLRKKSKISLVYQCWFSQPVSFEIFLNGGLFKNKLNSSSDFSF